jgi:hypothetical protein
LYLKGGFYRDSSTHLIKLTQINSAGTAALSGGDEKQRKLTCLTWEFYYSKVINGCAPQWRVGTVFPWF